MLALLAAAGERGVSRDKLLAYLWPENDSNGARHALRQLVYAVRRDLPSDPLISSSNDLRLDPELFSSDVMDFQQALERGDHARAMELYVGPFLDGFHLGDAPEFERWEEEERARLAQLAATTAEAAAKDCGARGDAAGAVRWWRKLAALDPLNGRVAVALMTALETAGDRSGALQYARNHEALIRQELNSPPDPAVLALVERLRVDAAVAPHRAAKAGGGVGQPIISSPDPVPRLPPKYQAPPGAPARSRVAAAAGAAGAAAVLSLGLFEGDRNRSDSAAPAALAVLPFENLGDSTDAYFAEGLASALRAKLSQVGALTVIAGSSSNQYRQTTKPVGQIGRELGADYLLTATVKWDNAPGGAGRVRVTPELVEVGTGHLPRVRWGQHFDVATTDVFRVQADMVGQVAQALGVALSDSTRRELAVKPTESLAAYDMFLRGEEASERMTTLEPPRLRRAVAAYERAVALDSTFVEAWARLAEANAMLYYGTTPEPTIAEAAGRAAERARGLAPDGAASHRALGLYYSIVVADIPRAFVEDSIAVALTPGNAELLAALAMAEFSLGRTEAARGHFEEAARLDPRSGLAHANLGYVLLSTRQYPEAEQAYDRALELAPDNLHWREFRAMVALAQSDLRGARAVLRAAPVAIDQATLVAFLAWYADLMWVLDDAQQQLLLGLPPSAFDGGRGTWAYVRMQTYAIRGEAEKARAYADSALPDLERALRKSPLDAQRHALAGVALAYLGRKAEAIREGRRAVELFPAGRSIADGAYLQHQLVRIYILTGEHEQALDQLEPLLKLPYILSPGWLRIDPAFDPLRGHPRFERLVEGKH